MNTISVICLISLILYILIALSFTKKDMGRKLFRMIYSSVSLGIVGVVSLLAFDSMMSDVEAYVPKAENVLGHAFSFLMLMIPVFFAMITVNLLLKSPRPRLFMIICAVLAVLTATGAVLYCVFAEKAASTAWAAVLIFCAVYIPFLLNFAISGLIDADTKGDLLLHRISLILDIVAAVSVLVFFCVGIVMLFGAAEVFRFLPVILTWLIMPIIPLWILNHQKAKDDERAGIVKEKFIDFSRLKKKARKNKDI